MEIEFWRERWASDQIGFHQTEVNPYLKEHFHRLAAPAGAEILVPLCGKSLDMRWLAEQDYRVVGVEVDRKAVADFFSENGLQPDISIDGEFEVFRDGPYTVYRGDFFMLHMIVRRPFDYCYDRASLIALPPGMRDRYVLQIERALGPAAQTLLIALEYNQSEMNGPPFSVPESEVRERYDTAFTVNRLTAIDVLEQNPRFQSKGLTALTEATYHLLRRSPSD